MKRAFYLSVITLVLIGSLTACTQDNSNKENPKKQKTETSQQTEQNGRDKGLISFDQEESGRLEQGILRYGESAKGGYYLTTVNSASLDKKDTVNSPNSVIVNMTVKNIRGELIDLSELKFTLKDEKDKKSYEGTVQTENGQTNMKVNPNESKTFNISFEVPSISDEYMLYIHSSLDPIPVHWKIDNLTQKLN